MDQTKSGLVLKHIGVAYLPPEAIIEGSIQEPGVVTNAIKNLVRALKIKVRNVCTSVSGYSVIIKKINLPTATRQELAENIEVEAEQFIPFDINDVNVDFQIIGQAEGQEDQMEVVLVAAKKDVIDTYMEIFIEAGLKPTIIDVDVFALENAFTQSYAEVEETIALVDIGANKMNINIIKNGISLMTKDAAIGGALVTGEIQDHFDLDYAEAEAIKLGGAKAPDEEAVAEIISRAVEGWVAESKRVVSLFESSYPDEKLQTIYLSGGSSRIDGLDRYFEKELGIPVRIFNPFIHIGFDASKFDPAYIEYLGPQASVGVGLALRRGEEI